MATPKAEGKVTPKMAIRDDQSWLVKNLDTGEERYVKSHEEFGKPMDPKMLSKDAQPWRGWWQEQRRRNEELLRATQAGDSLRCVALLHPADGAPPAAANAGGNNGRSALHLASANGALGAVKALLQAHATPDSCNAEGLTPLHLSAVHGFAGVAKALLSARADANVTCQDGRLPLHLATGSKVVLELQAYTSSKQEEGYTRTSDCSGAHQRRNGRSDAVRRLLTTTVSGAVSSRCREGDERPSRRSMESVASNRSRSSNGSLTKLRSGHSVHPEIGPNSFEFLVRLGRGAFGEVFHVKQKSSGRSYAMKVLHKEKVMGSNLLRYAFTERNILSYIQHPYIVSLHYAFQTPKHLVLVMQYCPGGNLQQLIRRLGRKLQGLSLPLAQLYAAELLLALQHLHERNIVYRDLKPDNVVLDAAGHAMLTDFGLSKDGVRRHLGTRTHCGSVAYLAPEILLGQKYGHTVDIYNLGVLLYNMLLGLPPFFHHEKETLQRNIVHAHLELPSILSTAAQSFIHVTMARDPRKRLGAASTADLRRHDFFRDMNFELLKQRKVPLPERLPPADADLKGVKPGRPPKISTLQELHRGAVPGWDFEAPKAMVECPGSSPCRQRRWRFRLCGLKW